MRIKQFVLSIIAMIAVLSAFTACSDDSAGGDPAISSSSAENSSSQGESSSSASSSSQMSSSSLTSSSSSISSSSAQVYTIMTYNVEKFDKGGDIPAGTYSTIANTVKTNAADVINLCEVESTGNTDETSFASALTTAGWTMSYHGFSSMSDSYNSIGYFSRYAVSSVSEILASNTRTIYRYKVTFPGNQDVWFYGCHLKSGTDAAAETKREAETLALANYVRGNHNPATEYIVFLGDMNTMNSGDWASDGCVVNLELKDDADASNNFTSLTKTSIYPSTTDFNYPSGFPLDHIVLSPALYAKYVSGSAMRVGSGTASSNPTDHYAVRLKIRL